jgi:glucose/mannose-6-phosphate isomerase
MTDEAPADRGLLEPGLLDDDTRRADFDPGDMAGAIATLGDQLRAAAERLSTIEVPRAPEPWQGVAVLGMGGSAMGADLLRGAFSDRARLPIVVSREPELPAWVGPSTLVIASSHSGGTAETLAATRAAIERGASIVAVTSGGEMAALGDAHGTRVAIAPGGQPRAALGSSAGLVLCVLAAAGVIDGDVARAELLASAAACDEGTARFGPGIPTAANPAKEMARWLESRIAVVIGGGHLAPVARRWKTQLNENAKTWAAWDELPELAHNTIVGLDAAPVLRHAVHVILLHGTETPEAAARRRAVEDELEVSETAHTTLSVEPGARLAEAFAGIILGDWVSYHLAMLRGVDPTLIDPIVRYKARLAAG